jgi:hypothetical protein
MSTPVAAPAVEFVASHVSPLPAGDYHLQVQQTVTIKGTPHDFSADRRFLVRGPRVLQPADIASVFPPENGLGEYSHTLPHVVLSRSTLPWERSALSGNRGGETGGSAPLPWLALLLFADDGPAATITTLGALRTAVSASPWWPRTSVETGDDPATKVTVIDVDQGLLRSLLPSAADLASLSHVRRMTPAGIDTSVVAGGRLPTPGGRSTVHLVSVDSRYVVPAGGGAAAFDFQGATGSDLVRLVSLRSWTYSCIEPLQTFTHLVANLDPYVAGVATGRPATLRLPPVGAANAEALLADGNVPMPHQIRSGQRTVSWYRGPLVPWTADPSSAGSTAAGLGLPVRAADALTRYDPVTGLFDVSYAAAWEIGRMLTLRSQQVSTSLYLVKRRLVQQAKATIQADITHLPLPAASAAGPQTDAPTAVAPTDPETTVEDWFASLRALSGVPFPYLVPDERMLPAESIRFFSVDPAWVRCLLDGAYSIGRITAGDVGHDRALAMNPLEDSGPALSGVLLRSAVVSGWPDLRIVATDDAGTVLPEQRRALVSPNVLLLLYAGSVGTLTVSEHPQALHFGFDLRDDGSGLFKRLRDPSTGHEKTDGVVLDAIPWRDETLRTVDIGGLLTAIDTRVGAGVGGPTTTSAQFALQMVEGVEQVVFHR